MRCGTADVLRYISMLAPNISLLLWNMVCGGFSALLAATGRSVASRSILFVLRQQLRSAERPALPRVLRSCRHGPHAAVQPHFLVCG